MSSVTDVQIGQVGKIESNHFSNNNNNISSSSSSSNSGSSWTLKKKQKFLIHRLVRTMTRNLEQILTRVHLAP